LATVTREQTKKLAKTKEWDIEYYEAGDPNAQAVIMLHGTGAGATGWSNFYPNVGPLSDNFRAIAMSFPGWGDSSEHVPTAAGRSADNARAVKLLMDELGIEKAALVGNSMGGAATIQFAVDYPDRLSHLITMGAGAPGVNIIQPAGLTEGLQIIREVYQDPSPENFRRLVSIMVYDSSFVTDDLLQARSSAALANRNHLTNWLKPSPVIPTDVVKLGQYQGPALIMHGRDDRVVNMEGSMRLLTILPNSRLHIFNHCGHWAQIEHANELNWLVREFIFNNPAK
jgi:2-hydroxy-6-oxonona-2,4-dienedioate hydrolase